MRATGIVRRVDDLGRIVIPKEVRRSLGIKEGDPLEIFISNEGELVLKPYFETTRIVDDFMETFKEMDITNKKEILIRLMAEIG